MNTLPLSYREEARYYFEEQINQGESFFPTIFDYFLGGIEYHFRQFTFFFSRYRSSLFNNGTETIERVNNGNPKIYCETQNNI